jgi:hypothetical protein
MELEACLLETFAAMLLCEHQRSRCTASADALAKLVLAYELLPLQVIPIRRDEQMLSHGNGITFVQLRKLVHVDEVKHSPEHSWLHVINPYDTAVPLLHEAEELCHEH